MNNISKATILMQSLSKCESALSEGVDRDYYIFLKSEVEKLISQIITLIPEEKAFINKLLGDDEQTNLYHRITTAISILEAYISEHKPTFLKTTIENAEEFKDEGLFNISAYCVRLYAESILKFSASMIITVRDKDTIGNVWYNLKKSGVITIDLYQKHNDSITRLNSIVHQDEDCQNNPPSTSEMTDLIRWARVFENDMNNLARNGYR